MSSKDKKAFILYLDYIDFISELDDEQAGQLLKAIYHYLLTDKEPDINDNIVRIAWKQVRNSLRRDIEKYQKTVENNSRKARIGGIIRSIKDGGRLSDESIRVLSDSNIGKRYLQRQGVSDEDIGIIWKRIEILESEEQCSTK